MCGKVKEDMLPHVPVGSQVVITPLSHRASELDRRVIRDYAGEAIAALGARPSSFTDERRCMDEAIPTEVRRGDRDHGDPDRRDQ